MANQLLPTIVAGSFHFLPLIPSQVLGIMYMLDDLISDHRDITWDDDILRRFVTTVKMNYRNVVYHNWSHAFQVGLLAAVQAVVPMIRQTLNG
jgi:hypothetical protein